MFEDEDTGIIVRERSIGQFRRWWPFTASGNMAILFALFAGIMLLAFLGK